MPSTRTKNKIGKIINKFLSFFGIAVHTLPKNNCSDSKKTNDEINRLLNELKIYKTLFPPGHFYSPIPDIAEIKAREDEIYGNLPKEIPGIDLNVDGQLALLEKLSAYYPELPFGDNKKAGTRYYYKNPAFPYGDAIALYSMIRYLKPRKIIEVGSGYSSCVTLDTNEKFFNNGISIIFIEPYPDLLKSLITKGDKDRVEIIKKNLQEVEIDKFRELNSGDILFIDSTHVSKINSDVNYIFSQILPAIKSGVIIHFHDIFYPFEYPKEWIYEGRAWNEGYMFRAFMQYNQNFKILFFNDYLAKIHKNQFKKMPLWLKDSGSLWIKKI